MSALLLCKKTSKISKKGAVEALKIRLSHSESNRLGIISLPPITTGVFYRLWLQLLSEGFLIEDI